MAEGLVHQNCVAVVSMSQKWVEVLTQQCARSGLRCLMSTRAITTYLCSRVVYIYLCIWDVKYVII